jgi:hypothetical protein
LSLALSTASAKDAGDGPWLKALSEQFVVLHVAQADINGDGSKESVVCYQDPPESADGGGGVAIIEKRGRRALFHVRFDKVWCEKSRASRGKLSLVLKSRQPGNKSEGRLSWVYGRDFGFPGHPAHPLADVEIKASSTLERPRPFVPEGAFDGNLDTTWAEGASGTGIGETLTVRFPEPVDVGYVGVFGGNSASERVYNDHNRIHRASFDARTDADLGDTESGLDFSSLGIGVIGDRVEYSVEDDPEVRFVRVDKTQVRELELRIDSVYLGNRYDDTHVAEVDVVPVLKLNQTLDKSQPLRKNRGAKRASDATTKITVPKKSKKKKPAVTAEDAALNALDDDDSDFIPDEL